MKKITSNFVIIKDHNGDPVRVDPRNVLRVERGPLQAAGSTTIHLIRAGSFKSNKIRVPQSTSLIKQALKFG